MERVSQTKGAGTERDPSLKIILGVGEFGGRQAGAVEVGAGPDGRRKHIDVPRTQFVGEAEEVLAAIEIASHDENPAGVVVRRTG